MMILAILIANSLFSLATLVNEFGSGNSIFYRKWPVALLIMAGLIYSSWLVVMGNITMGLEGKTFEFVSPLLLSVLCVMSMTPYLIFGTVKVISNAISGILGIRVGPRKFPEIEAMIRKRDYEKAQGKLYELEVRYPRNKVVKMLLIDCYVRSGKQMMALKKIKSTIHLVDDVSEEERLVALAEKLDAFEGGLLRLRLQR